MYTRRSFLACSALMALPATARAALPDQPLSFLAVGDWGNPKHRKRALKIARQMGLVSKRLAAQFVISTGDNFYPDGVESPSDPQWQSSFESVYSMRSLMCPWYPVLGNHDHKGNVQAQIAYAGESRRWRMPSSYYKRSEILSDGSRAEFFFLDTTPIKSLGWWEPWLGIDPAVQQQLDWLERSLANSAARWKIVVGHHPVFSGGKKGHTAEMVHLVKPLLDVHGVSTYINGHEHDLQHITVDGVHYITTGAGASSRSTGPTEGTRFAKGVLGFLTVELLPTQMNIGFIDAAGQTAYSSTIQAM